MSTGSQLRSKRHRIVADVSQISTQWLTAVLHRSHALETGSVDDFDFFDHVMGGLLPLLGEIENETGGAWDATLRRVAEVLPPLMRKRSGNPVGQTLLHGDLNPGNVLVPKSDDDRVLFIDRQPFEWSLTTWLGVSDVAHAIVPWWDSADRRNFEELLLKQYLSYLIACGVEDYSWEMLYADYRLCVAQCLFVPMEWCVEESDRNNMRWVWYPQLEKVVNALADLNIQDLLTARRCWQEEGP